MTARNLYNAVLIELNKENAPNILLEDFNYFANKAVNNYINKRYNIYDISQQTTDDLRVLKSSAILKPTHVNSYEGFTTLGANRLATYEAILPSDYLHLLNCICVYKVKKTYDCYNRGQSCVFPARRLTADMYSLVINNYWNRPTYKNPYYYIHNVNKPSSEEYTIGESDIEETLQNYTLTVPPTDPYDYETGTAPKRAIFSNSTSSKVDYDYEVDFSHSDHNYDVIKMKKYNVTVEEPVLDEGTPTGETENNSYTRLVYSRIITDGCVNTIYLDIPSQYGSQLDDIEEDFYNYVGSLEDLGGCDNTTRIIWGPSIEWEMTQGEDVEPIEDVEKAWLEAKVLKYEQQLAPSYGKDIKGVDSSRELNLSYKNLNENIDENIILFGNDGNEGKIVQGSGLPKSIKMGENGNYVSNVERGASLRYGNVSEVRLEIRYGTDNKVFELVSVYVDYIKAPLNIRLTQIEIDQTEDTSQMLEYPDYVCQEIVNELVHLIMENISDLRLQTHPVVSLSIANPAQALAPEAAG